MRAPILVALALAAGCSCDSTTDLVPPDGSGLPDGAGLDGVVLGDGGVILTCRGVGETLCGMDCVNTQVDPANCGGCGVACGAGEVCVSSGCAASCPSGLDECAGTCVDTESDNAHCGACDSACPDGEGCVGGSCVPAVVVGPPPARCIGGGPPIEIGGADRGICTGSVAGLTFTRGLCSCNDIGVPLISSAFRVDAYDSTMGPYEPGGLGGHVGANGDFGGSSDVEISGDLDTTSPAGLTVRSVTTVQQTLRVSGDLTIESPLTVGEHAFVGGDVSGGGDATITGTLHTPDCAGVPGSVTAGSCVSGPVDVAPPCRCDATEIVPIAEIVDFYAIPANHDNDEIGLDPDALAMPGAPGRLDLPCGYYYLSRVSTDGPVVIAVHGRTAVFVQGSLDASSPITFALDPGGTLDVFVAGVVEGAALQVGTPAYPARSRMYVGGVCTGDGGACAVGADCCSRTCESGACSGDGEPPPWSVRLSSATDLAGLFYAPNGLFTTSSALEMYGAIFAGDFHANSEVRIHYDRASTGTEEECDPPEPTPDGGVPYVCPGGAASCGPGLAACGAGEVCIADCCVFFG